MRFTASATAYIKAPRRVVYSMLTGYRQYETWVPDIVRSRLLAREGELAISQFIAPPYGRDKLVLEFIETPRHTVVFTQVDRFRHDGVFGSFDLSAADDGAGTMVKAALGMKLGAHRLICRKRMRQVLERTLAALADRARKLLTSGLSEVPDQRAKILEIEIGGDQMSLRIGGDTYELVQRRQDVSA